MCVRKVGYLVAEKCFVPIPLLPEEDATSKFVVETLCSNRACRYRQEMMVQSLAQCARSCGNFSCFYQGCRVGSIAATLPRHSIRVSHRGFVILVIVETPSQQHHGFVTSCSFP